MDTIKQLKDELEQEYSITQKFFEAFPEDANEYAPHEKSMQQMPLAVHIAEIFAWPDMILKTDAIDFAAGDYQPTILDNKAALVDLLQASFDKGKRALEDVDDETILNNKWSLRSGDQIFAEWTKYGAIRHALNQITHHRAQLGVYYRLQNIALPGSYGPSADDQSF